MKKWLRNVLCLLVAVLLSIAPFTETAFAAERDYSDAVVKLVKNSEGQYIKKTFSQDERDIDAVIMYTDDNDGTLGFMVTDQKSSWINTCSFTYDIPSHRIVGGYAILGLNNGNYMAGIPFDFSYSADKESDPLVIKDDGTLSKDDQKLIANTYLKLLMKLSDYLLKTASNETLGMQDMGFTNYGEPVKVNFSDVNADAYYYDATILAAKFGITSGIGKNVFGPSNPCTRGQIVKFIYGLYGNGEKDSATNFSDVHSSDYYYDAVNWAVAHGITSGTGNGKFSPSEPCTRAQAVTFLMRAANGKATGSEASKFTDVKNGNYYFDAVSWAVENNITSGTSATTFGSDEQCTRAQIVTFLYRMAG